MNYLLAIAVNRMHLAGIVAGTILVLGGVSVERVARHVRRAVLSVLRPAESATRRLIAVMAHGLARRERAKRGAPATVVSKKDGAKAPSFALFDPRLKPDPGEKRVPGFGPNTGGFDGGKRPSPHPPEPRDDDLVDCAAVVRRLRAVQAALDDLPRQAERLARAMMKTTMPIRAMRPGRPPGHRAPRPGGRWVHPVDEVLADCHQLALMALNEPPAMMKTPP